MNYQLHICIIIKSSACVYKIVALQQISCEAFLSTSRSYCWWDLIIPQYVATALTYLIYDTLIMLVVNFSLVISRIKQRLNCFFRLLLVFGYNFIAGYNQ